MRKTARLAAAAANAGNKKNGGQGQTTLPLSLSKKDF